MSRRRNTPRDRWPLALAAVFILALSLRAAHVASVAQVPLARLLIGDARSYDAWAQEIAAGDWIGKRTFYQAPLYPYTLAALYVAAGRDPMTVRWAQAVVGALACVALAVAGRAWFSERVGLAAAAMLALYPPAIFFDGIVQKAALDNLLMCTLLALLGWWAAGADRKWAFASGWTLGLFALTRENALVFAAVLAVWIPSHLRGRGWRERLAPVALTAAGMAAVLIPVGVRNAVVGGEFLITTSQSGSNFYIGNGPEANGRYVPIKPGREMPEFERLDATEVAETAAGRALTPAQVSSYWWSRTFSWMRAHPLEWVKLLATKWMLVWNRVELPDTESIEVYRDVSPLLRALGWIFGFGVLVPIACAGMVLAWRDPRRPTLLYAMLFLFAAAVALFYVFGRYRFPMVPILALFAGYAVVHLRDVARTRSAIVAAGLAAIVVNWPVVSVAGTRALSYANLGIGFAEAGRPDEAIPFYRKALDLAPREVEPRFNLALALSSSGRLDAAAAELATVLRLDPDHARAHDNYGVILARAGRVADAERHFREALRLDPTSVVSRNNLGGMALDDGRLDEAARWFEQALALQPGYLEAGLNLAIVRARQGRRDEARAQLRAILERTPDQPDALAALRELGGTP